jgi:hypothetical protein
MAACRNGKGNDEKHPNEATIWSMDDLIISLLLYFTVVVVRSCRNACATYTPIIPWPGTAFGKLQEFK